jgi:hypothetical protein
MPLPSKPESGHFFSEELWKTSGVSPLEIERANIEIFLSEARKYLDEKDVESLSGQLYSNANRLHPASSWERRLSKMALKYEAHQAPVPSEFNDVPHPALDKANVYDAIVYLSKRLKSIPDVPHLSKQDYLHYLGPDCRDEVYIYALLAIHEWMLHFRDPKNGLFEMEIFSPSEAKDIFTYYEAKDIVRLFDKKYRTEKEKVFENENTFVVSFVAADPENADQVIRLPGLPAFSEIFYEDTKREMAFFSSLKNGL